MYLIILGIFMPLMLLVHNVLCFKNKKIMYALNNNSFTIINDKYYILQLVIGILNLFILFAIGFTMQYHTIQLGSLFYIFSFWILNYTIKGIALLLKYIEYNK